MQPTMVCNSKIAVQFDCVVCIYSNKSKIDMARSCHGVWLVCDRAGSALASNTHLNRHLKLVQSQSIQNYVV